jgi:RNA methyltransferase, TrmH family
MITSVHNPKIQMVRKLQSRSRARREAGAFVVEGIRLVEEALNAGWQASLVLYESSLDERGQKIVQGFAGQGAEIEEVTPEVLHAASDTETPQGLLAVLPLQILPLPEKADFVFIPDGVKDPGNLGSMLRSAASAGVDAVLLPEATVDVFSPKVLRAAMGAHFRLPLHSLSWAEIADLVERSGLHVYLADAEAGIAYTKANFHLPLALVVGGEAEGASPFADRLATGRVHIPMPGGMESLNAAIAAALLLFEVVRQREVHGNR